VSPPTQLRKLEPEPVAAVVALLEEMLERARAGEIIGVGVVAACSGRADATSYTIGEGNIASLVLACRRLERRLLDHEEP
jgi:hypothetical protein